MELSSKQVYRLFHLFGALRDEIITPQEFAELNELMETYPDAQDYYLDYVYLCADLCNLQAAIKQIPPALHALQSGRIHKEEGDLANPPLTLDILKILGDYENKAEALELPSPKVSEEPVIVKTIDKKKPTISKLSIVSLITSLAAVLFIMVYPLLFPPPPMEVAYVSDVMDAQWSVPNPLEKGARLETGTNPIQITKGIIKIHAYNGAHLVLEAPAEFRFTNANELSMNYGRVFVDVTKASNGFVIQTNQSKIIDVGTKFGVYTNRKGESELHVFEGKTILIVKGLHEKADRVIDVIADQARKFGDTYQEVRSIALRKRFFVQDIKSKTNQIWHGDKSINLADVVGGGDGLGTGKLNTGIYPSNRLGDEMGEMRDRRSSNRYNPVPHNLFIDGVFVPNGSGKQMISSDGHVFRECPVTSGYFYTDILNTPTGLLHKDEPLSLALGETDFAAGDNTCLCIHANGGITFDLSALRSRFPEFRILRFDTTLGLSNRSSRETIKSVADFWILVDGQVRYKNTMTPGAFEPVEIEITDTDRFLTLAVTDGGSLELELDRNAIGYDWGLFGEPRLILEE